MEKATAESNKNELDQHDTCNRHSLPTGQEQVLSDAQRLSHIVCEPCSFDNDEVNASTLCIDCLEYLCNDCYRDHKKNKMTRNHKILVGDDLPSSKVAYENLKALENCKTHIDKPVEFKCIGHNEYICATCEARTHRKCDNVEELKDVTEVNDDRGVAEDLLKAIDKDIDIVMNHNKEKADNVDSLQRDILTVSEELEITKQELNDLLKKKKENALKTAEDLSQTQTSSLNGAINDGEVLIKEYTEKKHVLQAALKFGNSKQIHLAVQMLQFHLMSLREQTEALKCDNKLKLKYVSNLDRFSSLQLGSVKIADMRPTEDLTTSAPDEFVVGSDTITDGVLLSKEDGCKPKKNNAIDSQTSATQTTYDLKLGIPLMHCKLELVGTYNVRQQESKEICNINGCVCLPENIVLIDSQNALLLVFNHTFAFKEKMSLGSKPMAICKINDQNVVVALENHKVETYYIYKSLFYLKEDFNFKLHCRGVADAGEHVALLISDEDYDVQIGENDIIEVQVRKVNSGHKVREVDSFVDKLGKSVKMNDPRSLLYTNNGHVLIGEKNYLADFNKNGCRERFFKSYKDHRISDIRGLTLDDEGNIYVCGRLSNNVHQISMENFYVNRIVITDIEKPLSIAFDSKRKRLLVGLENSDHVHEYMFTT